MTSFHFKLISCYASNVHNGIRIEDVSSVDQLNNILECAHGEEDMIHVKSVDFHVLYFHFEKHICIVHYANLNHGRGT